MVELFVNYTPRESDRQQKIYSVDVITNQTNVKKKAFTIPFTIVKPHIAWYEFEKESSLKYATYSTHCPKYIYVFSLTDFGNQFCEWDEVHLVIYLTPQLI